MNRHDGPLTCKSERIREVGCAMRGSGSSSPARVIPRGFVCVLPLLSICVVFMVQPAVAADLASLHLGGFPRRSRFISPIRPVSKAMYIAA